MSCMLSNGTSGTRGTRGEIFQLRQSIPIMAAQSDVPDAGMDLPPAYPYPRAGPSPYERPWLPRDPSLGTPYLAPPRPDRRYSRHRYQSTDRIGAEMRPPRRGRSVSSSLERGRGRHQHIRTRRYYSHSKDDRDAVRRDRDRGVRSRSVSSNADIVHNGDVTLQRQNVHLRKAEERINRDKELGMRKYSAVEQADAPTSTTNQQGLSGVAFGLANETAVRMSESPMSLSENEMDSILPQRGSTLGAKDTGTSAGPKHKNPVQYQKPYVVSFHCTGSVCLLLI